MTEDPEVSVLTARRAAQHVRLSSADDACEHLCILTLLSSLAPLRLMLADTPVHLPASKGAGKEELMPGNPSRSRSLRESLTGSHVQRHSLIGWFVEVTFRRANDA